ncbi:MAG TPA: NAD(P)/FAD-dependent oxidoreductase, partial [Alphaproteobacteria bacterium]
REVLVLDHAAKIGEKIRIAGGGKCNFTNLNCAPDKFLSNNLHFCKSALAQYTQQDFIALIEKHGIPYHEKTLGQLFCDNSSADIINMLLQECRDAGVEIKTSVTVDKIETGFNISTSVGIIKAEAVVIATGGPSIPKMGSTGFGYDIAKQFGLNVIPPRAGLVPLVFDPIILDFTKELSGLSVDPVEVTSKSGKTFREAMLFTHRGISGPAILQISSYWNPGEEITINMAPDISVLAWLKEQRKIQSKSAPQTLLSTILPKRLAQQIAQALPGNMADQPDKILQDLADRIARWRVKPSGSEGYRTAEVTLGGVDTNELSSKTFETKKVPGLYFIGEVVDVTGHLGGYNFQWAWSSGWCAGQIV